MLDPCSLVFLWGALHGVPGMSGAKQARSRGCGPATAESATLTGLVTVNNANKIATRHM